MTDPRWKSLSAPEEAVPFTPADFCENFVPSATSPIDVVYGYIQGAILLGTQQQLETNAALGRLLLLGFVSSVDSYFRHVLAGTVECCPFARARVADKMVPFGAISYYDPDQTAVALFENSSFASIDEIKKATQSTAGASIPNDGSLHEALRKYEALCHLRHATTHAGGSLTPRLARAVGIDADRSICVRHVKFDDVQTAARIAFSAVRAYNRWLYAAVIDQWLARKLLVANWETDSLSFTPLYELFRSRQDGIAPATAYHAWVSMRPAVRARLAADT
jgi:hypothetical protein